MDFQVGVLSAYTVGQEHVLPNAVRVLAAARAHGDLVIHVVVGFRPGAPEVHPDNAAFGDLKRAGRLAPGPALEIHPAVAPAADGVVVTKHRVGAFPGTDLDMILRASGVRDLALCGVATSGVVLSTVRHAADADYRLAVLRDACADADAGVHDVLMERVFPRQAQVIDTETYVAERA
jgi:nicotinamidase-related amidase